MKTTEFLIELSESSNTDFGKKYFFDQGFEQQVFSAVFGSSGSIFMDGFRLYFVNSHGESAHFTPNAYRAIGAPKSAKIIERASRVLSPNPIPEDRLARKILVDALSESSNSVLEELGQEFYSTSEIIDDLLFDYVARHTSIFGAVPENVERQAT
jgi:hypothetical protein